MGVTYEEGEATSVTGDKLFTAKYLPNPGPPVAILVMHHGLAEHIGRYKDFATELAESGIAVYLHDAFGHGKSAGERAYIPSMELMVQDFHARREAAVIDVAAIWTGAPRPPVFVGGHSMGGLLCALAVQNRPDGLAGALVMSAALGVSMTLGIRIQLLLAKGLVHLIPRAPVLKLELAGINADPKLVQAYVDDPLNTVKPLSMRTAHSISQGMAKANQGAAGMKLPLYFHHGEVDIITYPPATKAFYAATASKDKVYREIPGAYHEPLQGPEKQMVMGWVKGWILDRATPVSKI